MSADEEARPNFSGVWSLNIAKSTLRAESPKRILVKIEHHEPHIKQSVLVTSADDQERRMTFTFTTTGAETPTSVAGGLGRTKAHWQGSVLVIESSLKIADRERHFRDHWSLSNDQRILTMTHPDDDLAGQISTLEPASPADAEKFGL
jgi:hypothetical protein